MSNPIAFLRHLGNGQKGWIYQKDNDFEIAEETPEGFERLSVDELLGSVFGYCSALRTHRHTVEYHDELMTRLRNGTHLTHLNTLKNEIWEIAAGLLELRMPAKGGDSYGHLPLWIGCLFDVYRKEAKVLRSQIEWKLHDNVAPDDPEGFNQWLNNFEKLDESQLKKLARSWAIREHPDKKNTSEEKLAATKIFQDRYAQLKNIAATWSEIKKLPTDVNLGERLTEEKKDYYAEFLRGRIWKIDDLSGKIREFIQAFRDTVDRAGQEERVSDLKLALYFVGVVGLVALMLVGHHHWLKFLESRGIRRIGD